MSSIIVVSSFGEKRLLFGAGCITKANIEHHFFSAFITCRQRQDKICLLFQSHREPVMVWEVCREWVSSFVAPCLALVTCNF